MILRVHHNKGHRLAGFARILLDQFGLHLVRLARVAVGFAQQAFGLVKVALTRRVQSFKAQTA